ncbi:putative nuclease HARBI1 [Homarus americanus]|uniref:putative nuclease HARBI1 n=1 Tax=Homarus americanus TaxID=6706 RepID=UPI001C44E3D4|nr:putative nuclease HARBI1 [Homarus americanus]
MQTYRYREDFDDIEEIRMLSQLDGMRKRRFRVRRDPFQYYNEEEFIQRYRLSKDSTRELLTKIRHHLPMSLSRRGIPIPPGLQLLVAMRYMATGKFQITLGDCSDMSQPSVSKCVRNVSAAIATLAREYIKFPSPEREEEFMQEFASIAGMPSVIGCVDGTHIPIKSPGEPNPELYRCRKNFFSINVMAVCDAHMKFTNLVVNWPGSAHDSHIFTSSRLCESLQAGDYRGFLLGDSEYALRPYLLTPIHNPTNEKQRKYNRSHINTRTTIERTFGVWKRRFAVLQHVRAKRSTTKNIIIACAVLHNIALISGFPLDIEDMHFEDPDDPEKMVKYGNNEGQARREYIVEHFF